MGCFQGSPGPSGGLCAFLTSFLELSWRGRREMGKEVGERRRGQWALPAPYL